MNNIWAVVVSGGSGSRFAAATPKQYSVVAERTLVDWTLEHIYTALPEQARITVVNQVNDQWWWHSQFCHHPRIALAIGGETRMDSVYAGLQTLIGMASENDWVLVHDMARPCVRVVDIQRVIQHAMTQEAGSVLAIPVRDTLKRVVNEQVAETINREGLWQVQTPQVFRFGLLIHAIEQACYAGLVFNDEASAMEWQQHVVGVALGSADNIKVTYPEDLLLADAILRARF